MNKILFKTASHKMELAHMHCITRMTSSGTTWLKTEVHWKFLSLTLLTIGRNKTLKWLLLLTKRWKLKALIVISGKKKVSRLKENKVDLKNGWHVWSCRWSWIFQSLYTTNNIDIHSSACPLWFGSWKIYNRLAV